ncbi:MAG: HIT family protein [Syntrophomonadaceae bacterium]|mgnify:FL=1|nr:HIT family protein [Syntrophomonadaceae bacterium]
MKPEGPQLPDTSLLECPFCRPDEVILENRLAWARFDPFPVNPGHLLVITRRHVTDFFQSTEEERAAINSLLEEAKILLDGRYNPDGYNIGINCGPAAGQTIMHLHIHLIPRYQGDMDDPRGGVRGVIPEKQKY